jgi:hypothetical protein
MSAETIENMAYNYMLNSRNFDNQHDWKEVDAAPVESWIQREATILLEPIRERLMLISPR